MSPTIAPCPDIRSAEQKAADRTLVQSPKTKALRAKVAPMLQVATGQIALQKDLLPSYVNRAIADFLESIRQWEREEKSDG